MAAPLMSAQESMEDAGKGRATGFFQGSKILTGEMTALLLHAIRIVRRKEPEWVNA